MIPKLVRLPSVKEQTGLSRSSIYAKIANGSFPSAVPIGKRAVAWVEEEVQDWIQAQIAEKFRPESCNGQPVGGVNATSRIAAPQSSGAEGGEIRQVILRMPFAKTRRKQKILLRKVRRVTLRRTFKIRSFNARFQSRSGKRVITQTHS